MKVVYICAPYRADTEHEVRRNIERARGCAESVWCAGAVALCPHLNTGWFGGLVPEHTFLDGDCELIRRCDAVYVDVTEVGPSLTAGMKQEVEAAKRHHVPVLISMSEVRRFIATDNMPWPDGETPAPPIALLCPHCRDAEPETVWQCLRCEGEVELFPTPTGNVEAQPAGKHCETRRNDKPVNP